MKNKYYTPELEEFHVGFTFEFKDWWTDQGIDTEGRRGSEYQEYILQPYDFYSTEHKEKQRGGSFGVDYEHIFDRIQKYINSEDVRVKYLDREDIESLGFKYYKTHPGTTTLEFEGDKCNITFDSEFSKYWNITITHTEDGDFTYFHGSIKNKSELKKVMKMIGI